MDLVTLVFGVAALLVVGLVVVVVIGGRMLRNSGESSGMLGDAFGNFIDVFDPSRARTDRELKRHLDAGPVTKSPDDEDDDPVRLIRNPDGSPRAVRIRRPGAN